MKIFILILVLLEFVLFPIFLNNNVRAEENIAATKASTQSNKSTPFLRETYFIPTDSHTLGDAKKEMTNDCLSDALIKDKERCNNLKIIKHENGAYSVQYYYKPIYERFRVLSKSN
jgi:hypothetical protein